MVIRQCTRNSVFNIYVIPGLTRDLKNMKQYYVYILTNHTKTVLYVGVTSDLIKRVWQHRQMVVEGFSREYKLGTLVYFEVHQNVKEAIKREKRIKKWKRKWKEELIARDNQNWEDLYQRLLDRR